MPRVYRHGSKGKYAAKWYIEFRDAAGRLRRQPGYRDKGLTIALLAEVMAREERIAAGKEIESSTQPLSELIDRWHAYTLGKGAGKRHADSYRDVAKRVVAACGMFDCRSLNAARAQDYLDGLIARGRTNRCYQYYRAALCAFGRWLSEKEKLIPSNPFTSIDVRNPELNRKIVRRVLTPAELTAFLQAARNGRTIHRMTGEQRYYLYLVAVYTGLRFGALCQLTPAMFRLDKSPSVTSNTSMQKNRKSHTVPLPADVAKVLRKWFKGKPPDDLLWPALQLHRKRAARFVRFDLRAAKIPYRTPEGQVDFHSLRHCYAVALVRSGAGPVEVQHLLDHCSPTLTARYFRHLRTDELRAATDRLPRL